MCKLIRSAALLFCLGFSSQSFAESAVSKYLEAIIKERPPISVPGPELWTYQFSNVTADIINIQYGNIDIKNENIFFNGSHFHQNNCDVAPQIDTINITGSYMVGKSVTLSKQIMESHATTIGVNITIPSASPMALNASHTETIQVITSKAEAYNETNTVTVNQPVSRTVASMHELDSDAYVLVQKITQPIIMRVRLGGVITPISKILFERINHSDISIQDYLGPDEMEFDVSGVIKTSFGSTLQSSYHSRPLTAEECGKMKSSGFSGNPVNAKLNKWSSQMTANDGTIEAAPPGAYCEWIPNTVVQPAVQCGFNDIGAPNSATYQCGKNLLCQDICNFIACQSGP